MIVYRARASLQDTFVFSGSLMKTAFAAALVEILLYGVHLVLLCLCAFFLIRKSSLVRTIILLSLITIFALATADVALTFNLVLHDIPAVIKLELSPNTLVKHVLLKHSLFVTNNIIADALLLYRCYLVWDRNRFVSCGCVALILAETILGYYSAETFTLEQVLVPFYYWIVFAINIIITATTAGRMWWIARVTRATLGLQHTRSYKIAIVILIESGAIYALSIMLLVMLWFKPYNLIFNVIVYRMVGITPTMMIVQIEVGGRVLKANSESTTHPMFTTLAVNTMSTQLRAEEELAPNIANHFTHLSRNIHTITTSTMHARDSPKAEV